MATFVTNLFSSIFTPGPTPTLIVATNISFAALQLCLLALLILTYSVHFVILSFLSAGLWWAINWFVTELQAANEKEKEAKHLRDIRRECDENVAEDSGTETEAVETVGEAVHVKKTAEEILRPTAGSHPEGGLLRPESAAASLRKRRSSGEASGGDISTDSEWDKVEEEGDMDR